MIIRYYEIGALFALGKLYQCGFVGNGRNDAVSPFAEQSTRSLQHNWSIVDNKNDLAFDREGSGMRWTDGFDRRDAFGGDRKEDCESRTAAHSRGQFDFMLEEPAQPVDNRQAKPEAAVPVSFCSGELKELAENILPVSLRDAGTAVPNFDTQHFAAPTTSDDDSAMRCIAHGI